MESKVHTEIDRFVLSTICLSSQSEETPNGRTDLGRQIR